MCETELLRGGPRRHWEEGAAPGRGSWRRAGAAAHQAPPYLLGYVFKFICCQFPLEGQSENVRAALMVTTAKTAPYLESAMRRGAPSPAPGGGPHCRPFTDEKRRGLER